MQSNNKNNIEMDIYDNNISTYYVNKIEKKNLHLAFKLVLLSNYLISITNRQQQKQIEIKKKRTHTNVE